MERIDRNRHGQFGLGVKPEAIEPKAQPRQLALQMGTMSSALEHAVPEQMFTTDPADPPDAISAVKALAKANAAGQRIYHITQANQASALPNIHHRPETMAEIASALAVGKEAITHTDPVSVPGWSGAGYIILDPDTGDGAYKIGGGADGGRTFIDGGAALIQVGLLGVLAIHYSLIAATILPFIAISTGVHLLVSGYYLEINDPQANFDVATALRDLVETLISGPPKIVKAYIELAKIIIQSTLGLLKG